MINFREKGNKFERTLALQFGEWWCGDKKAFWRNTSSGGRATTIGGGIYGGDIVPVNTSAGVWPLCVEAKNSQFWSLDSFFRQNPSDMLLSYMLQCLCASQEGCNTVPILVCHKNLHEDLCFLYAHGPVVIKPAGKQFLARLSWRSTISDRFKKKWPWDGPIDFYCLHLTTFFARFCREDFLP